MRVGLIMMTALVPTIGHKFLIDFATNFHNIDKVLVIISTRTKEPTSFSERSGTLFNDIEQPSKVRFYHHADDNAPQHPNPTFDFDYVFWKYWETIIKDALFEEEEVTHVFASETYGETVADMFRAQFIPVDMKREVFDVRGTRIRGNIFDSADKVTPSFVDANQVNIVTFGQESVGKTTVAKLFSNTTGGHFHPEWARGYLETVGSELTPEKMENIFYGQLALEKSTAHLNTFVNVYDTDLLSTYGYFKLLFKVYADKRYEIGFDKIKAFLHLNTNYVKNKTYIVLSDNIPFEEDILRYGGNKRETKIDFWIDILNEFKANYFVVYSDDYVGRRAEIEEKLNMIDKKYNKLRTIQKFFRDQ